MAGFNPFKKKSWQKAGRDIEKGIDKAKREAERAARDAAKAAEKAAYETEKAARAAAKELEKATQYFEKEAERVVQQIFDRAKREIEDLAEDAVKGAKDAFTRELPALAEHAFDEAKKGLTEELPQLAEDAIHEVQKAMLREATAKVLAVAVDLVDTIAPDSLNLTLGPVGLSIGDVVDKAEALREIAAHPPDDAASITDAVMALAPDEISIDLSVGVGFIVQSDSAQVGVSLGWSKESVLEHLPSLLRKCGVP